MGALVRSVMEAILEYGGLRKGEGERSVED